MWHVENVLLKLEKNAVGENSEGKYQPLIYDYESYTNKSTKYHYWAPTMCQALC